MLLNQHFTSLYPPDIQVSSEDKKIDFSHLFNRTTGIGHHSMEPFNESFIGNLTLSTKNYKNVHSVVFCKDFSVIMDFSFTFYFFLF